MWPEPREENAFLAAHAALLLDSYRRLLGQDLLADGVDGAEAARALYEAPFFVASHDTSADPVLTYGNRVAQDLFEMSWEEFTSTPSRFTAEEPNRAERARLLGRVAADGFIEDYSGIRISKLGRRFRIRRATVWNLLDEQGRRVGQAATFAQWEPVPGES